MAVTTAAGFAITSSGPTNGASIDLWLSSRFGVAPSQGTAAPSGSPDFGPVTSGTSFGGPGAWTITGVAEGDYYVRVQSSGVTYWSGPYSFVENSDVVHQSGAETISGNKTFAGGSSVTFNGGVTFGAASIAVGALSGILPIASGGTGSAAQNFVDLSSAQTVGGVKTFSATPVFSSGLTVSGGALSLPNASIPSAAVQGLSSSFAGVDTSTSQTITGQKTFFNDLPVTGGRVTLTALTTPSAPVVNPNGANNGQTWQYQIVATAYDGNDGIPSTTGQTTTGSTTLTNINSNTLTWSVVTGAASYKVLRNVSGTFKVIASGLTTTTYTDTGSTTPSPYSPAGANPGGSLTASTLTLSNQFSGANVTLTGSLIAASITQGTQPVIAVPAIGAVASGVQPTASTTAFLVTGASTVVTLNSSAVATIAFPSTFPNGVVTVVAGSGDANESGGAASPVINVVASTVTRTGFQVQVLASNTTVGVGATTSVRINWIALGY